VAGFYNHVDDKAGPGVYTPKEVKVEDSLHFIAVHVESKLLQMQRDIDSTIYKDDAYVRQELEILLGNIEKGFDYCWAASAQQYVEYVEYNLQKLYDRVLVEGRLKKQTRKPQNVYWIGWISQCLLGVATLKQKVQVWINENQTKELTTDMAVNSMAKLIEPKLVLAQDDIKKAGYETAYNSKLLENIIDYIKRSITTPGVTTWIAKKPRDQLVWDFLPPKHGGALLDDGVGGRMELKELLEQLLELSLY
jgi:hypothetical protein